MDSVLPNTSIWAEAGGSLQLAKTTSDGSLGTLSGIMLWLTSFLSQGRFVVDGFWPAFLGGLIVSVVTVILSALVREDDKTDRFTRG